MKKFVLAVLLLSILLASCSTIPKESGNSSIIILPVIKSIKDTDLYYMYYKVYYKEVGDETIKKETYLTINPNKKSYILKSIKPGNYEIYAIEQIYIKTNTIFNRIRVNFDFSAISGIIKILESGIEVSFVEGEDGKYRQHVEIKPTSESNFKEIKEDIMKMVNIEYWIID